MAILSTHVLLWISLLLNCLRFRRIEAFTSSFQTGTVLSLDETASFRFLISHLFAASASESHSDEEIDLQDWRKFRAALIDSGLPGDDKNKSTKSKPKNKSVALENEKLLEQQNAPLAQEYRAGAWAHVTSEPEIGGLLCRMPIEAEIYCGGGYWKDKLNVMLSLEENTPKSPSSMSSKAKEQQQRLTDTQVSRWFKMAERLVGRELESITSLAKGGILNPNDLEENARILLGKYINYKQTWQQVCLLLSHTPETGCSEFVVINRPITSSINRPLAQRLLEGTYDSRTKTSYEHGFIDEFVQAFGASGAVYMGGPDLQAEPALLLHGIPDLPGAQELAPGVGLYQGGIKAAVQGVLAGQYQPLDFRFFLGRCQCDPANNQQTLLGKCQGGEYKPIACARSVALKQCLGLPKPLWHEVLELCGGEMKSLSDLELSKRIDLQR